jgi:hypothetical protein
VLYLNLAGLADSHVEVQLDSSKGMSTAQPSWIRGLGPGLEADLVVACISGSKGESSFIRALLVDDTVVVVENFL